MKAATLLLAAATLMLSACSSSDNEPPQQGTSAHIPAQRVKMDALAASACTGAGGTVALSRQLDGSAVGMCQMVNGRRCDESALLNGSCLR